jgi:hypothetical protein
MKKIEGEINEEIAALMKKHGRHVLFTIDKHGRATDAAIHDAILDAGNDEAAMEDTRERARRRGLSEELIELMYGKFRSMEEFERALEEVREQARRSGWAEGDIERHYGKPAPKK